MSRLRALDARLDAEGIERLTLAPGRAQATSLREIAAHQGLEGARQEALVEGMVALVEAIRRHFPDNLFWDLDGLVAITAREAGDAAELAEAFDELVALHALFGEHGPIRFRYVHDFLYGFDWARWVRRDAATRAGIHPFSRRFVRIMLERGARLLEQIAEVDAKYPPLPDARHRNPFGFSREPADEARLYRDLAAHQLVPVSAWTDDAPAVWDRPYARAREERARALGLGAPPA